MCNIRLKALACYFWTSRSGWQAKYEPSGIVWFSVIKDYPLYFSQICTTWNIFHVILYFHLVPWNEMENIPWNHMENIPFTQMENFPFHFINIEMKWKHVSILHGIPWKIIHIIPWKVVENVGTGLNIQTIFSILSFFRNKNDL